MVKKTRVKTHFEANIGKQEEQKHEKPKKSILQLMNNLVNKYSTDI